jgi:hypothetical protein
LGSTRGRYQDAGVLGTARVPAEPAAGASEARPVHRHLDGILAEDEGRPKKQRHTSKRIFELAPSFRSLGKHARLHLRDRDA